MSINKWAQDETDSRYQYLHLFFFPNKQTVNKLMEFSVKSIHVNRFLLKCLQTFSLLKLDSSAVSSVESSCTLLYLQIFSNSARASAVCWYTHSCIVHDLFYTCLWAAEWICGPPLAGRSTVWLLRAPEINYNPFSLSREQQLYSLWHAVAEAVTALTHSASQCWDVSRGNV